MSVDCFAIRRNYTANSEYAKGSQVQTQLYHCIVHTIAHRDFLYNKYNNNNNNNNNNNHNNLQDRICGLVARAPGYWTEIYCASCEVRTEFIYVMWSSGEGSWLQIQKSGFDPGATRCVEEYCVWNGVHSASWVQLRSYLEEKVAAPGLEIREYGCRDPTRWPRGTLCPQKLALTLSTSGGRSIDIVRSRTQATEFFK
jgi:hypothetical protein